MGEYRCYVKKKKSKCRTGDRLGASGAPLGEELAEALGAVRLVVARRESLSRQGVVAVAASEAVSVPRLVLVRHAAAGDDLRQREGELASSASRNLNTLLGESRRPPF